MFDKIRILVVDDDPGWALDSLGQLRVIGRLLTPYFEAMWIKTPDDAKEYLAGFEVIDRTRPSLAGERGLVPEMIIFDYSFDQGARVPPRERQHDGVLAVDRMRRALIESELPPFQKGRDWEVYWNHPNGDFMGCYIGVELARTFSGHPCGAVPTTARSATRGTEAGFFEWLNDNYFPFEGKERISPNWDEVITVGCAHLRSRLKSLCLMGVITPSNADLLALSQPGLSSADLEKMALTIESRYGRRRLPIAGLFADDLVANSSVDPEKIAFEAVEILRNSWVGDRTSLQRGRDLAQRYFTLASSDPSYVRYAFSRLVADHAKGRPSSESAEVQRQIELVMGITVTEAAASPTTAPKQTLTQPTLTSGGISEDEDAVRWAVLFLCVRAEHERWEQLQLEAAHMGLDEDLLDELSFSHVLEVSSMTEDEAGSMLVNDPGMGRTRSAEEVSALLKALATLYETKVVDGTSVLVAPQSYPSTENLVYRYLDPLPSTLLTFEHKKKGEWTVDYGHIYNALKRNHLRVSDVLAGRPDDGERFGAPIGDTPLVSGATFPFAVDAPGITGKETGLIQSVAIVGSEVELELELDDVNVNARGAIDTSSQKLTPKGVIMVKRAIDDAWSTRRVRLSPAYGVRPGEVAVLRQFAVDIGFSNGRPLWLTRCK